ncbi:MAG TPA: DUF1835 domain-containing protein [Longimicrobium sp.]|nr:DUF1835 domain-containing protein [Longimicrobium sp.]
MLHVTNGDSAAERIRAAGVEGTILPWRDVLHDGPVPAGLPLERLSAVRAEFLAARGGGDAGEVRRSFAERDRILACARDEDEVVLWFEHDLYDQLQLLQVLDWFADHPHPRLTLINPPEYLGMVDPEHARELFETREPVSRGQLALGRWAWDAFRGPDPRQIETVVYAGDARLLPHLPRALLRLLQEYPGVDDGLSRSERQALQAFAEGPRSLREAYPDAHHAVEDAVWMGDWSFAGIVETLANGHAPLLRWAGDAAPSDGPDRMMERHATLTDAGRDVLMGRADAVWLHGIDRWIGGVHLHGRDVRWRWNDAAECIAER